LGGDCGNGAGSSSGSTGGAMGSVCGIALFWLQKAIVATNTALIVRRALP